MRHGSRKLVVEEAETRALRELLAGDRDQLASAIVAVEVIRAVRRRVPRPIVQAHVVVAQISVIELTETIRAGAAQLEPVTLRSLDALHLATALEIGDDLGAVVTYDARMAGAAESLGADSARSRVAEPTLRLQQPGVSVLGVWPAAPPRGDPSSS